MNTLPAWIIIDENGTFRAVETATGWRGPAAASAATAGLTIKARAGTAAEEAARAYFATHDPIATARSAPSGVALAAAGWRAVHQGGGATAWRINGADGVYFILTSEDGASAQIDDGEACIVCAYSTAHDEPLSDGGFLADWRAVFAWVSAYTAAPQETCIADTFAARMRFNPGSPEPIVAAAFGAIMEREPDAANCEDRAMMAAARAIASRVYGVA